MFVCQTKHSLNFLNDVSDTKSRCPRIRTLGTNLNYLKPCVHRAYRFGFLVLSLSLELALKIALQWTRKKKVLSHLKESDRPIFRPKSNAIEMKTSSFLSLSFNLYRFLLTSMQCIVILIECFGHMTW